MIMQDEVSAIRELEQKIDKQTVTQCRAADLVMQKILPLPAMVREVNTARKYA
jgi:hypothetical protein